MALHEECGVVGQAGAPAPAPGFVGAAPGAAAPAAAAPAVAVVAWKIDMGCMHTSDRQTCRNADMHR